MTGLHSCTGLPSVIVVAAAVFVYLLNNVVGSVVPTADDVDNMSPTPSPSPGSGAAADVYTLGDVVGKSFVRATQLTPPSICGAGSVRFGRVLYEGEYHPARLPHATISFDNKSCNVRFPGVAWENLTDGQLFADAYIPVVPISRVYSEDDAFDYHATMLYDEFFTRNRSLTRSFFDFARANDFRSTVYIGLEWFSDRTCGDVTMPKLTYVFFARFNNPVNLAPLFPFEQSLTVPPNTPFHLSFAPTDDALLAEYSCAYFQPTPTPEPRVVELRLCFPGHVHVVAQQDHKKRKKRRKKKMSELRIGDKVLDADGRFVTVVMFSHRTQHTKTPLKFREIDFSYQYLDNNHMHNSRKKRRDGHHSLTLSHGHFIILHNASLIHAADVRPGHVLKAPHSNARLQVTRVRDAWHSALFNPHTTSGSIVVNGVATSCYTRAVPAHTAHALLAPVRAAVVTYVAARSWMMHEVGRTFRRIGEIIGCLNIDMLWGRMESKSYR